MKWCDLLRVKSELPINLWPNAVQAYHRWVRELASSRTSPTTASSERCSPPAEATFASRQVNFFGPCGIPAGDRSPQAVALTFMGTRVETWPNGTLSGMAAFFQGNQVQEDANGRKRSFSSIWTIGRGRRTAAVRSFPTGPESICRGGGPPPVFADWLIRAENPWFAENIVNRIWYWLLGMGIVNEPDDIRPDNPPTQSGIARSAGAGTGRQPLRSAASLPVDSQFGHLSAILHSDDGPPGGREATSQTIRFAGWTPRC